MEPPRSVSRSRPASAEHNVLTLKSGAFLNGTLYLYGGQAKSTADQTTNTWSMTSY